MNTETDTGTMRAVRVRAPGGPEGRRTTGKVLLIP